MPKFFRFNEFCRYYEFSNGFRILLKTNSEFRKFEILGSQIGRICPLSLLGSALRRPARGGHSLTPLLGVAGQGGQQAAAPSCSPNRRPHQALLGGFSCWSNGGETLLDARFNHCKGAKQQFCKSALLKYACWVLHSLLAG